MHHDLRGGLRGRRRQPHRAARMAGSALLHGREAAFAAHMLKVAHFDNPERVCTKAVERVEGGEDQIWGMAIWSRPGAAIQAPTMEELVYLQGEETDEETDVEALYRLTTELAKTRTELLGDTPHW